MKVKTEFAILLALVFLIASVVWVAEGTLYAGLLYLVPPIVIGLAAKYPEVPLFQVLTVKILPSDELGVHPMELAKLRCLAYIKLFFLATAVFGMLIPFVVEGHIGADYENPTNLWTILFLILPVLLLITLIGLFYNLVKFAYFKWVSKYVSDNGR